MRSNPKISVISPVYGCGNCLNHLYARLINSLEQISPDFEIILVNDSSPDDSWEIVKELCGKDKRVIGINLSRNFGQHYAITAGLDQSRGDWVVVMDCDLQDRPEEIPALYQKAMEGYDVVFAQRIKRRDNIFKRATSKLFHKTLSFLTNTEIDASIANFGIFSSSVIKAVCSMREQLRWFPTFVNWVGFKNTKIPVEHSKRDNGRSGYTFKKLIDLAFNVLVLNSNKPLKLVLMFGFLVSFASIAYALIVFIRYLMGDVVVLGWASLVISIWFLSGVIIFVMGIVGIYIGKIFDQIKERPLYIIKDRIN
jgi:glycosyltransferase involved in cell wall biosynthesis